MPGRRLRHPQPEVAPCRSDKGTTLHGFKELGAEYLVPKDIMLAAKGINFVSGKHNFSHY
jgi:hypothetical protein